MTLITSRQALDMLSAHAPRAWCKRLLSWEVFDTRLDVFAAEGTIIHFQPAARVLEHADLTFKPTAAALDALAGEDDEVRLPIMRAAAAKNAWDPIETIAEDWQGRSDEPLPFGLIPPATIDWELGTLSAQLSDGIVPTEWLAHVEETFESGPYESLLVNFTGLSFDLARIEMLAPAAIAPETDSKQQAPTPRPKGRPPKWDWEGAMAHIASLANAPDGLPTDAGAQAQIARLITDWFVQETSQAPAESEVRKRAATILGALTRR